MSRIEQYSFSIFSPNHDLTFYTSEVLPIYTVVIEGKTWPFDINGIIVEMNLFHLENKIFPCKSIPPVPKSSLKMFFEFPPSCQYIVDAEILRTDCLSH